MDREELMDAARVMRVELVMLEREMGDWERRKRHAKQEVQQATRCVEGLRVRAMGVRGRLADVEGEVGRRVAGGEVGRSEGRAGAAVT